MPPEHPLHRSPSFHARFSDKVRNMKFLKKSSRSTLASPTITESSGESSEDAASSSASSVLESHSTSLSVPSTSSFSPAVTQRQPPDRPWLGRPKSGCYSSRHQAIVSPASSIQTSVSSNASPPLCPRLVSVQDGQWAHQNLLLVLGQVGFPESPINNGQIVVHHHMDAHPVTQWPITDGYFKALVRLDPGPNRLRFEYTAPKIPAFSTTITVHMLPLAASPPLQLAILLAKDSTGEYECLGERKEHEGNTTETALKKLRMAACLSQAFTGEQMYRARLGRRCFRLEEEWGPDTLSNRTTGTMRNIPKVHVIRSESTVEEIRNLENSQDGDGLREITRKAVSSHFGPSTAKRYVAVVLLDAKGDLRFEGISGHSALGDGLGIAGSLSLFTLPSCIEEVGPSFIDCTRISNSSDSSESEFFWEAATATLGNMMEAFLSPQTPLEPRNFTKVNRTFVTKEPYSLRTKSAGLKLSLPQEECTWPRVDCLRFRYHPCFRLPPDPMPPSLPDAAQVYPVEVGIVACASSGIPLVLIYADNIYCDFLEYSSKPERELLLQEDIIRSKLPSDKSTPVIKLRIFTVGQGETTVEDLHAMRRLKIQLPKGHGTVYKSAPLGYTASENPEAQEILLHTDKTLLGIRIFHNSSALEGLEFQYDDQITQLLGHKGSATATVSEYPLDTRKGETLMGFCVRAGEVVGGIEILTSFGRRSSVFGNPQDGLMSKTLIPPRGRSIAGVAGTCSDCVTDFSILYK